MGIRIVCELEAVGDSLIGRTSRCGGETREFTGWLGLIGALQALLAESDSTSGGDPADPEPRGVEPTEGDPI